MTAAALARCSPATGYPATVIRNISWIGNSCGNANSGASFGCSVNDSCAHIAVEDNVFGSAGNFHCGYIQSYTVSGNTPPGMQTCMANSMHPKKAKTDDTAATRLIPPDDAALTFSGRAHTYPNGSRLFDWAANTIMIAVTNSSNISLVINETKCSNRYAVYNYSVSSGGRVAFGPRKLLLKTNSSVHRSDTMPFKSDQLASNLYALFRGVPRSSTSNLLIFKATEPNGIWMPFGPALFQGLVVDAAAVVSAAPAPWRENRRLEIFGDSITCCYGCTGTVREDPTCDGVAAEDAWFSWGAALARNLESEYHLQAWSAIGLLNDATPFSPGVMETMVGRTLGARCGDTPPSPWSGGLVPCSDTPANDWDVAAFPPSAVIMNLGVNDGLALPPAPSRSNASQWASAVASVAARYAKGTPIVMTVGPWLPAWPRTAGCGVLCNFSLAAVEYGPSQTVLVGTRYRS